MVRVVSRGPIASVKACTFSISVNLIFAAPLLERLRKFLAFALSVMEIQVCKEIAYFPGVTRH